MGRSGQKRVGRAARTAGLRLGLLLGVTAPGCLLPELVIDGSQGGSGGSGSTLDGDASGGSAPTDGGGGVASGGVASGSGSGSGGTGSGATGSGATGSGAASAGGGSGGESAVPPVPGYFESGGWHGVATTFAEFGQVDPSSFDDLHGPPYCMSGTVDPRTNVDGRAGFSWFLNQAATCEGDGCVPPTSVTSPVADGVVLRLDNPGGSPLRVQVQGAAGVDDPNDRWCVDLAVADGLVFVPWAEFNTECWAGGNGNAYGGQDLQRLMVFAPGLGDGQGTVAFDFCVEVVGESNTPHQNCLLPHAPGLGSYSLSGTESAEVVRNTFPYVVRSNLWGDGDVQVIEGTGTSFEIVTPGQAGVFPGVFVGEGAGLNTGSEWLPKNPFSAASTIVIFRWDGTLPSGGVALVEMLFSTSGTATDPPSHALQFWLDAEGRSPGGTQVASYLGDVNRTWAVHSVVIDGVPTAVFVSPQPMSEYLDSPMPFIVHAMEEDVIAASAVVTSVSGGFQLPSGGGDGLRVEDFCANSTVD